MDLVCPLVYMVLTKGWANWISFDGGVRHSDFSKCLGAVWLRSSRQLSDSSLYAGARVFVDGAMTNCTIGRAGGAEGVAMGSVILVASAGAKMAPFGLFSADTERDAVSTLLVLKSKVFCHNSAPWMMCSGAKRGRNRSASGWYSTLAW